MDSQSPLLAILQGVLAFAIVLPVLVAVHELGHYWAAKAFGMRVEAFAVMMGGIRRTSLDRLLPKPLAPASRVWALSLLAVGLLITGVELASAPALYAGLALACFAVPVWVVTRLGALYHIGSGRALSVLVKSWGIAAALYLVASKGSLASPMQLLAVLTVSSLVGTLIVYYHPVLRKPEDGAHGHGQIEVDEALASREKSKEEVETYAEDYATRRKVVPVLFRPLLARTDRHGTEFSLLCLPLGGFAAIKGMHPKEDGSETVVEGGFYSKSPLARLVVLFAGPLFSILFGILLLTGYYTFTGETVASTAPVIGVVTKDGPAYKAGLRPGDRLVEVNGSPVTTFFDAVKVVRTSHRKVNDREVPVPLSVKYSRDGKERTVNVTPVVDPKPSLVVNERMKPTGDTAIQAKLQMGPESSTVSLPLSMAFVLAVAQPVDLVAGLAKLFVKPAAVADSLGGPATIAEEVARASQQGVDTVVFVAALLSISLGVMNLLPIVPFDGGQMLVAFAELLRGGKRLSIQLQATLSTIGAFLVILLILGVVTLDISRHAVR